MQAFIDISPAEDVNGIARAAGSTDFKYDGGRLICADVAQAALDAAYTAYDAQAYAASLKIDAISRLIQEHLDTQAQQMGYDSIFTAVTYAEEPGVASFQSDGLALRAWRSRVWDAAYTMLADWEAGNIAEPSPDDVLAAMPIFGGVG